MDNELWVKESKTKGEDNRERLQVTISEAVTIMPIEKYEALVEECKAALTEAVFTSRWAIVEGHWHLGESVDQYAKEYPISKFAKKLAGDLSIAERTIWYAVQFYRKFPELDKVPEGKNITWTKLCTRYLPESVEGSESKIDEKECDHEWERILTYKCKKCGKSKVSKG